MDTLKTGSADEPVWFCEHAKSSRSSCKKCKKPIAAGSIRIGREFDLPVHGHIRGSKSYYHPECLLLKLMPSSAAYTFIRGDQLSGYDHLSPQEQNEIDALIDEGEV